MFVAHHLLVYSASLGSVTDNDTPAINDGIVAVLNTHFVLPRDMILFGAYAQGANLGRARISSPTLRQVGIPFIEPVNVGANPANNPSFMELLERPFRLRGNEEIALQITTTAVGPAQHSAVLFVADRLDPAPIGDIFTIRATGATAAVANAWTSTVLTFADQLPVGTYAVVGAIGVSATMEAFRLTFDAQYLRPGGIGVTAEGNRPPAKQLLGGWGKWGEFRTNSLPRAEVLCGAADATQSFYFQVIKLRDSF